MKIAVSLLFNAGIYFCIQRCFEIYRKLRTSLLKHDKNVAHFYFNNYTTIILFTIMAPC